jgi:hypothetical protein
MTGHLGQRGLGGATGRRVVATREALLVAGCVGDGGQQQHCETASSEQRGEEAAPSGILYYIRQGHTSIGGAWKERTSEGRALVLQEAGAHTEWFILMLQMRTV